MDRAQIYEAIRQADAAGDREAVIKLNAYLKTLDDQQVVDTERSGVMPGALGAAGAVFGGGKALEAGVRAKYPYDVNAPVGAQAPAEPPRVFQSPGQVAERVGAPTTPGAPPVEKYGRAMNVPGEFYGGKDMSEAYKKMTQALELEKTTPGYKVLPSGDSSLLLPEDVAKEVKTERATEADTKAKQAAKQRAERLMKAEELRKAEAAKAAEAAGSPKEVAKRAVQKTGNVMHKATSGFIANPLLRAATGFGAGYGISDAAQRAQQGDIGRALISGAGALGDIAAMSRHPIAMPIGAAVGTAAPLVNMYLDELEKEGKLPFEGSLEKLEEKAKPKKKMKEGGLTAAWQRSEGKNPEGGLNAAGRASYKRETGGELKPPVSAEAAKKSPKKASRRKSFCARMSGMKKRLTSAKTANDPDSRINKALRKWDC